MIYDIILLAIFGLFIYFGIRKGAAKSLANLLLTFVSYVGATFLGKMISVRFYELVLRPTIHDTVVNTVYDFSNDSLNSALDKLDLSGLNFNVWGQDINLGDSAEGLIRSGVHDKLSGTIDGISDNAGQTAVTVVEPIVIGIMAFFLTIFLFFVIWILLRKFVMPLLLKVFKLPIIKQVNMILGGVIGAVEAFLLVSMLAYLLRLIVPQVTTETYLLRESTIYNSFIFKYLYDGNIFSTFASWLQI